MSAEHTIEPLSPAKKAFVENWGEMGPTWGINRTMAQVHALLMAHEGPLSTDDIMAHLRISRGNASMNLRELMSWGLVRKVVRLGERREYYEGEKEVWRVFCNIARERKRRELDPLHAALVSLRANAKGESPQFLKLLNDLEGFVDQASHSLDRMSRMENSRMLVGLLRALEKMSR